MRGFGAQLPWSGRHHQDGPASRPGPWPSRTAALWSGRCSWPRRRRSICFPYLRGGRRVLGDRRPYGLYQARSPSCLALDRLGARRTLAEGRGVRRARAAVAGPGRRRPPPHCPLPFHARVPGRSLRVARPALRSDVGDGRSDLSRYADDIAQVSLAAAPFVSSFVRQRGRRSPSGECSRRRLRYRGLHEGRPRRRLRTPMSRASTLLRMSLRRHGGSWIVPATDHECGLHVGDVRRWAAESDRGDSTSSCC